VHFNPIAIFSETTPVYSSVAKKSTKIAVRRMVPEILYLLGRSELVETGKNGLGAVP
jgi:hypothetical protein